MLAFRGLGEVGEHEDEYAERARVDAVDERSSDNEGERDFNHLAELTHHLFLRFLLRSHQAPLFLEDSSECRYLNVMRQRTATALPALPSRA